MEMFSDGLNCYTFPLKKLKSAEEKEIQDLIMRMRSTHGSWCAGWRRDEKTDEFTACFYYEAVHDDLDTLLDCMRVFNKIMNRIEAEEEFYSEEDELKPIIKKEISSVER